MVISFPVFERTPRLGDALALVLGMLMPLAFAPMEIWPLAILLPAGLFVLWEAVPLRRIFWRGFLFGAGMFGVGVSWVFISIHTYGKAVVPVALAGTLSLVVVLALFPALSGLLGNRWGSRYGWLRTGLGIPAAWVLFEWVRGSLFTGFPFLHIGYSQIDSPLSGYAPLLGVYGVGFLVMFSAACLVLLFSSQGMRRLWIAVALAIIWTGGYVLEQVNWTESRGESLRVSIVQGNIPQNQKWLPRQQQATLQHYVELTSDHWDKDVVVWPETAIPLFYHQVEQGFIRQLQSITEQTGTSLITGIPLLDLEHWDIYNTVMSVGETNSFYRKQHLVAFGEYIPMRKWLGGLLEFFTIPLGDFSRGAKDQRLIRAAGYPVGTSVCYEIAFGNEIIRALPEAAWLVNVSNDGWFGDSLAPHQHLEISRMRAKETGRYLLRATNTGVSALIDPKGKLIAVAPQFEASVVTGTIVPLSGATPYVRFGDWLVLAIALMMIMISAITSGPGRKH